VKSVSLSLLQRLVAAHAAQASEWEEAVEEPTDSNTIEIPDLILGIEEPELYQHPNRQRHLARILWQLSQGEIAGVAKRTQVIYSTHSPLFVDLCRFDCVRRLSKASNEERENLPLVTKVSWTSLDSVARDLQAAQDSQPQVPFTADSLRAHMAALMTPWMNEGFFADVVVLVEGEDERSAILGAALSAGVDLEGKGIAVIPCGGKKSIDRPYLVFSKLGLPTYVIFDGDRGKDENHRAANRCLQRLLSVPEVKDAPPDQITRTHAIFEADLDTIIRSGVGEPIYTPTATQFMREHGYPDFDRCKKSPAFIEAVLARASEEGIQITDLQAIVNNIVGLLTR